MVKKRTNNKECCNTSLATCCKIDSVVQVDARGQIVIPKDLRERADIKAGDKIAIISCESEGEVSCIAMIKSENLKDILKEKLGPLFEDISG